MVELFTGEVEKGKGEVYIVYINIDNFQILVSHYPSKYVGSMHIPYMDYLNLIPWFGLHKLPDLDGKSCALIMKEEKKEDKILCGRVEKGDDYLTTSF